MGEVKNVNRILGEKPEGSRPVGRSMSKWKNNFKMGFKETGREDVDWIHVAQDREPNKSRVP